MVLSYASIHKHSELGQDRNQAVCALQTEPIVCRWAFNGPTAGHKEHTAPARAHASHWPILSHPEERRQLAGTPSPPCCTFKSMFCVHFLFGLVRFSTTHSEISTPHHLERRFAKACGTVEEWAETGGETERKGEVLLVYQKYSALTHVCTLTYKHMYQPLPLTPSCTAA